MGILKNSVISLVVVLTLSACGSEGQHQADNGNADIVRLTEISSTLQDHGIVLNPKSGYEEFAVNFASASAEKMSLQDLESSRALIREFIEKDADLIRILNSGDVIHSGNVDWQSLKNNAERILNAISAASGDDSVRTNNSKHRKSRS